jgi:hypothetical protein
MITHDFLPNFKPFAAGKAPVFRRPVAFPPSSANSLKYAASGAISTKNQFLWSAKMKPRERDSFARRSLYLRVFRREGNVNGACGASPMANCKRALENLSSSFTRSAKRFDFLTRVIIHQDFSPTRPISRILTLVYIPTATESIRLPRCLPRHAEGV